MSCECDGVITPPMTPTKSPPSEEDASKGITEVFAYEEKEEEVCWFVCQGTVGQDYASVVSSLKQNCHLKSGEGDFFRDDFSIGKKVTPQSTICKTQLFGCCFDKGSALIEQTDYLLQNMRKTLLKLERNAHPHNFLQCSNHKEERYRRHRSKVKHKLRPPTQRHETLDYVALRKQIVTFCFYTRNFMNQLHSSEEKSPVVLELISNLVKNLYSLHWVLGPVSNYPQHVFQGETMQSNNKGLADEYHLCHLYLDLEWFSITIAYVIALMDEEKAPAEDLTTFQHSSHFQSSHSVQDASKLKPSVALLDRCVYHLLCELICLSVERFRSAEDSLLDFSPFSCSCVFQLWILLYSVTTALHQRFQLKSYWSRINELLNTVLISRQQRINEHRVAATSVTINFDETMLPDLSETPNMYSYVFWMLYHVAKALHESNLSSSKFESNHTMLESILRKSLEKEATVQSPQLRECFAITEILVTEYWEPNPGVVFVLWEYFQQNLDRGMFLVQGESFSDQWKLGDGALSFLNQVQEIIAISPGADVVNLTIFKQFLRILCAHLGKCKNAPRIKSRILSKFSARKINSLSEPGLINFFALFLSLGIAGDIEEVCKVVGGVMNEVEIDRRMSNRRKMLWRGYLALVLLTLEKRRKVDSLAPPMIRLIKADLEVTDSERMMPLFFDAFQEMLLGNAGLDLGQLSFIDSWIEKCILSSSELEKVNLLNVCSSLLCFLNAELSKGEVQINSGETKKELWQLQVKLWSHLIPHLKQLSSKVAAPKIVGEVLAAFMNFSLKIGLPEARTEKVKALFRHMLSLESVQLTVMIGYLKELIKHENAVRTLTSPYLFIQAWIKCSFLHEEKISSELIDVADYISRTQQNNRIFKNLIISKGDIFIDLVKVVRSEYNLCLNPLERKLLRDEAITFLGNVEKLSSERMQNLGSQNEILRIYERAGFLVSEAGPVIHTQSGIRTLLHRLLDIFLLPQQVRDPAYKLHPFVSKAMHHNLNLFIQGLVRLGANSDLLKIAEDSLTMLMPRLIRESGALNDTCPTFSLLKCFTECRNNIAVKEDCCVFIFQTVAERLIKKRFCKNQPNHTLQAIAFIADVASVNRNKEHTVQCILDYCLEPVASVAMFYEKGEPCQKNAERLINGILTIHIVCSDPSLRQSAMNLFSKLCKVHLAFSSLKLFDLFVMIAGRVPQLFKHFLPQLITHVETVEKKRNLAYDKSLRDNGIKRIEQVLSSG